LTGRQTPGDKPLTVQGKNHWKIESLVHTNTIWVFSEDIEMQFGIEKFATIELQRGIVKNTEGMVLPSAQVIQKLSRTMATSRLPWSLGCWRQIKSSKVK